MSKARERNDGGVCPEDSSGLQPFWSWSRGVVKVVILDIYDETESVSDFSIFDMKEEKSSWQKSIIIARGFLVLSSIVSALCLAFELTFALSICPCCRLCICATTEG